MFRSPSGARARRALPAPVTPARPSLVLGAILATYLMIVLDASVVITALPSIREGLGFSAADLSWVQSAYALTFGGLLLLGARAGDVFGQRRTFTAGIALFTAASLAGGLAQSPAMLLAARALQGVGAAIAAPSTLALLTTSFAEGPARTRALAAYSAVAGGGGSVGLVLGGLLTDWVSWRWGLLINVPVGIALVTLAPRVLPAPAPRPGRFDLPGAATSTLGMTALVYGLVRAAEDGWGDPITVAGLALGAGLVALFLRIERRADAPITPLRLFADRRRSGAYAARMLLVGGMFSMFFFLSQYLQGVRGLSPLETGIAFLPMTGVMFAMVRVVPALSARWGDTRLLITGVSVALVGMTWLSRVGTETDLWPGIAVPLALLGVGMGSALAPLTAAGIAGVAPEDAGAASGLLNAAQQVGAALGVSVLVTVFSAAGGGAAGSPESGTAFTGASRAELAHGIATALTGSAVLLALGLAVVLAVIRGATVTVPRPTTRMEAA